MPQRSSLTGSFATSANEQNEVVCPLKNNDGTLCRKRCFGVSVRAQKRSFSGPRAAKLIRHVISQEKRYRSMQEHIRRAHPDNYISKLPATEESFNLMVNTDPKDRPQNQTTPQQYGTNSSPAEAEWDADRDGFHDPDHDPQFSNYFAGAEPQSLFANTHPSLNDPSRHNNLMPADFPPGDSPRGLGSAFGRHKGNRSRKPSVVEHARKPKHERQRSKEEKRLSSGRKMGSIGPGNKWEELLDAAASATEEESRDLTPMPTSPRGSIPPYQGPNHTQYHSYNTSPLGQTILQQSPDEPGGDPGGFGEPSLEAFPSVESSDYSHVNPQSAYQHHHNSSADSSLSNAFGYNPRAHQPQSSSSSNFHIPQSGLSSSPNDLSSTAASYARHLHGHSFSQPTFPTQGAVMQQPPTHSVQHYCAACHKITPHGEGIDPPSPEDDDRVEYWRERSRLTTSFSKRLYGNDLTVTNKDIQPHGRRSHRAGRSHDLYSRTTAKTMTTME
ncbi:MAG: hypothetical protein Q9159_005249 [Coniocarpon cinnabarinum]